MPDGSAGPHNLKLAEWLFQEIKGARISVNSGLALQWEIAEALEVLSSNALEPWRELGNLLVIAPPKFAPGDVNGAKLRGYLAVSSVPFAKTLLAYLPESDQDIEKGLDDLLNEPNFYRSFIGLALENLERPKLGPLATEERVMPGIKDYPDGLAQYQRIRVNRLIMEAVIQDRQILNDGAYLSTQGVIQAALQKFPGSSLDRIQVVAHPAHSPRCDWQLRHWLNVQSLDRSIVIKSGNMGNWPWYDTVAQHWCRSPEAWTAQEEMVRTSMKNPGT
ncbi:MAG: hypothetical protein HN556_21245 [Gammaproteobacteria bacterium]|jgi:hypothetical protein|nr:hypothetical protein [Gammaproteobacteria bacterium]MBT7799403.1 hypothetical protein [Gammaproteobacteria bacterium]